MEWLHPIEKLVFSMAAIGEAILEALGILCVLAGIVVTLQFALKLLKYRKQGPFPFIQVRLQFGFWLALALEFQLGADILKTTIAPSNEALIQLAVIAVIRTFLNYFLGKEIEEQLELQEKTMSNRYQNLFDGDPPAANAHE
jgi:uncharacterized membrane protein